MNEFFLENLFTIIFVPLWVFLIIAIGKFFAVLKSRLIIVAMTVLSTLWGLIMSFGTFVQTLFNPSLTFEQNVNFLKLGEITFGGGCYIDSLSVLMALLVCVVSILVQIYSYSYMKYDSSFARFFAYLNLFNFSMFGLILSPNLFQTYIFWELVGVSSYLLIGFWYKKPSASIAAVKAFLMNRIGDFGLLLGLIILASFVYLYGGNPDFITIPFSSLDDISILFYAYTSKILFIISCGLILLGSIAKSAQFPLHTWLVDAMEGPTPVSALIHSATMVAAGVYLVARLYPLYTLSTEIMQFILIIGLATALICAYFAITQTDIKKVLAYSTNSQLGLMFFALGAGCFSGAIMHLYVHAFTKALLFLCAGIVIHASCGCQNLKYLGGFKKLIPTCALCFMIAVLSLSGLLFSGLCSKEFMLNYFYENNMYEYSALFLLIGFMTTFYIFRLYFLIFEKDYRSESKTEKATLVTNVVITTFAVIVIGLSFVLPIPHNKLLYITNMIVQISALVLAFLLYGSKFAPVKIPIFYNLSYNGLYIDKFYDFISTKVYAKICKLSNCVDKLIFDGGVSFATLTTRVTSWLISRMQSGHIQSYLAYSLVLLAVVFVGLMFAYSFLINTVGG